MPRLKKNEREQADVNVKSLIAFGREQFDYTNDDVARLLGVSPSTFRRKLKEPSNLTLGEVRRLKMIFKINENDIIKII